MKSEHLIIIKYNQESDETTVCLDVAIKELNQIAQLDMYKDAIDYLTQDYEELREKVYKVAPKKCFGGMFSAS